MSPFTTPAAWPGGARRLRELLRGEAQGPGEAAQHWLKPPARETFQDNLVAGSEERQDPAVPRPVQVQGRLLNSSKKWIPDGIGAKTT